MLIEAALKPPNLAEELALQPMVDTRLMLNKCAVLEHYVDREKLVIFREKVQVAHRERDNSGPAMANLLLNPPDDETSLLRDEAGLLRLAKLQYAISYTAATAEYLTRKATVAEIFGMHGTLDRLIDALPDPPTGKPTPHEIAGLRYVLSMLEATLNETLKASRKKKQ